MSKKDADWILKSFFFFFFHADIEWGLQSTLTTNFLSFQWVPGDLENADKYLLPLYKYLKISDLHDLYKSRQHSYNLDALWMVNDPGWLSGFSPHWNFSFDGHPRKDRTFWGQPKLCAWVREWNCSNGGVGLVWQLERSSWHCRSKSGKCFHRGWMLTSSQSLQPGLEIIRAKLNFSGR